jgi:hypothetical protein
MPWVNNKRITAGERSHNVDIIAPAGTLAEADTEVEVMVPASIVPWPVSSQRGESMGLGGVQNQTVYTVNINYRTDVPSSYVLQERCCTMRRFQVTAVVPADKRDSLDLTCVTAF